MLNGCVKIINGQMMSAVKKFIDRGNMTNIWDIQNRLLHLLEEDDQNVFQNITEGKTDNVG